MSELATPLLKFRLLAGSHFARGPVRGQLGESYGPGDIIETTTDLVRVFGADKFERVTEGPAALDGDDAILARAAEIKARRTTKVRVKKPQTKET